jgi:hypothetical protein
MTRWVFVSLFVAPDGACRLRRPSEGHQYVDHAIPRIYHAFTLRAKVSAPRGHVDLANPATLRELVWQYWEAMYPHLPHPAVRLGIPP